MVVARPGMGNSYRSSSSSSSSSGTRSSYSSYKPSTSSYSNSSKSYSSSGSYTTSSIPEPTSYFDSTNHSISVSFHADGTATIRESFRIKKNQSKIGIKRPTILIHGDTKISNLLVTPEHFHSSHNNNAVIVYWPEAEQNPETDITISYQIDKAYLSIDDLKLVNWRFSKTSNSSNLFTLNLEWDPNTFSQALKIQEESFNERLAEYERINLKIYKQSNVFRYNPTTNSEISALVVIDVPILEMTKDSADMFDSNKTSHNSNYALEEVVKIRNNGEHVYTSKIQISNQYTNLDSLHIPFGINRFRETGESTWNQMITPAFQVSYGFEGLSTYFWHLFHAQLTEGKKLSNNQNSYEFKYHTLGEASNRLDLGVERWIRITSLEKRENLNLESFSIRVLCESEIDPSQIIVDLVALDCEHCTETLNSSSLVIPLEPKWETDGFRINWDKPFPNQYQLYLRVFEKGNNIQYNPFLLLYAILNAFFHSPGSGNHLGHLTIVGILCFGLLITVFIFYTRNEVKRSQKKQFATILSQLKQLDPTFDFQLFKEKIIHITKMTASSWDKGDMEPSRNFLSAAVFQRFSIQLQLMKQVDSEVNRMKDFSVVSLQIVDFSMESDYLTLHIKIKCKTKDKTFPIKTSELEIQSAFRNESFIVYEEIHSYTRKTTTQTKPKIDLIHNLCPSCGASAKHSHVTNKCEYCGCLYNSGEADWVLTEITQTVEWNSTNQKRKKNSSEKFAKQILEDRAATVFWKYLHFISIPKSQMLHRESLEESYQTLGNTGKEPMHTPVVGSCHLVELNESSTPNKMTCEIRWSVARKKGLVPEHRRSRITLALPKERPNVLGFSELSCENCGAPLPEVDANECGYCHKPIPEKVTDWLFESIEMISL